MTRSRASLFPDAHAEGQGGRVTAAWRLDYPLPMPHDTRLLDCPVCRGPLVVKDWRYHVRQGTGSRDPYRCDVRMKCTACSLVLSFGVAVPEYLYRAAAKTGGVGVGKWIGWRAGKAVLAAAGYFNDDRSLTA